MANDKELKCLHCVYYKEHPDYCYCVKKERAIAQNFIKAWGCDLFKDHIDLFENLDEEDNYEES